MVDWICKTWKGWTFALCLLFSYGMVGAPNIMAQSTQNVKVAPDCVQYIWLTAASSNAYIDNRQNGCTTWNIAYSAWGFSALSLVVQSAPNDATGNAPGTFVTYAGTVVSGSNPNTATTQAETALSGYYPWVRVTLASKTGTGGVVGTLYGWRTGSGGGSGGGGGGGTQYDNGELAPSPTVGTVALGTDGTNLRALSTTAGGALNVVCSGCTGGGTQYATGTAVGSPTGNVALGYDGANVRAALTDTSGRQIVVGAAAAGAIVTGNPVLMAGTWYDTGQVTRMAVDNVGRVPTISYGFGNGNVTQPITIADVSAYLTITPQAGPFTTQLIAAGTGRIRIVSLVASMGNSNTTDFSIVTGTGVDCGTGTTVLFSAVAPASVSYPVQGQLRSNNNAAICISGDAATTEDWKIGAIYAIY